MTRSIIQQLAYCGEVDRDYESAKARAEWTLHSWEWRKEEAAARSWTWAAAKRRQPTPCELPGYDIGAEQVKVLTPEQQALALLAPSKAELAAAHKARCLRDTLAAAATSSHVMRAGSAESQGEERHPLAAPGAAGIEAALDLAQDSPTPVDARAVYFAFCDILEQGATLADRWPRTARRNERGEWSRGGIVTEWLDAQCYAAEHRWVRAEKDLAAAQRELEIADRANKHGEIDMTQVMDAEQKAVARSEEEDFFHQQLAAARATYERIVGAPWHTRLRIKNDRAVALALTTATLRSVTEHLPAGPEATHRVIVMGGGIDDVPELPELLARLRTKYPALTLYSGNRDRGPEGQLARWCVGARQHIVFFKLDEKDGRAAPFRRNARMLEVAKPHGILVVGPRSHGPTDALVDAAKALKVPVWDRRTPALAAAPTEATPASA